MVPPTRVSLQKRPQTVENKGRGRGKERKERKRVRKSVRTQDLSAKSPADGRRDGARRESIDLAGAKARVERKERLIESVGERIVVGAGFAVGGPGGRLFLASPI